MRSPDAAWIQASRWDALSETDKDRFSPICPDFMIELRSPSESLVDLEAKMDQWIANGAAAAWLIDPDRELVAVYHPEQPKVEYSHPSSVLGDGPIVRFELTMERIWK